MLPHQAALRPTGRRQVVEDLEVLDDGDADRGVGGCACQVRPEVLRSKAMTVAVKSYTVGVQPSVALSRSVRGKGLALQTP